MTLVELQSNLEQLNSEHDQIVSQGSQIRQQLSRLRQQYERANQAEREDLEAEISELSNQAKQLDTRLEKIRLRLSMADRDYHDAWWRCRTFVNHIVDAENRLKPGGEHSQKILRLTEEFERQLAALQLGIQRDEKAVADLRAKLATATGGIEADFSREPEANHRLVGGTAQRTRYVTGGIFTGV